MGSAGALAGKTIVVTRPQAQAEPLAQAIVAAGGQVLRYPLLEISACCTPGPLLASAAQLSDYALAIFISPNAVDFSVPVLCATRPWPANVLTAAIGQGTVRALAAHGIAGCIAPSERFDSEALLALPALAAARIAGRRLVIFRGDGGRELLAETLIERGAQVDCITCYQRRGPSQGAAPLLAAWRAGQLAALTVSSSEGLRYLFDLLDEEGLAYLQATPLFVPHARIADNARALGAKTIILTEAGDEGILVGLTAYNWPG